MGPYFIVNKLTGKFAGPFTTQIDCLMARTIASAESGWATGEIYDKVQFDFWLNYPPSRLS